MPSILRPALATDVMAIEREIGASLPNQYQDFLVKAGTGVEYGGLAVWYHLDLMMSGNIIEASKDMTDEAKKSLRAADQSPKKIPKDILVISDRCDGSYLCLRLSGNSYNEAIWIWDSEDLSFEKLADDLEGALDIICECQESEMNAIHINWVQFSAAAA